MTPIIEKIIITGLNTKEFAIPPRKPQAAVTGDKSGKVRESQAPRFSVPFTRKNYTILGVGVGMLLLGYFFMSQPPHDGFMSLTLAPLILTVAYCFVLPWGIIAREKASADRAATRGD